MPRSTKKTSRPRAKTAPATPAPPAGFPLLTWMANRPVPELGIARGDMVEMVASGTENPRPIIMLRHALPSDARPIFAAVARGDMAPIFFEAKSVSLDLLTRLMDGPEPRGR
jgi:hypothetical protein